MLRKPVLQSLKYGIKKAVKLQRKRGTTNTMTAYKKFYVRYSMKSAKWHVLDTWEDVLGTHKYKETAVKAARQLAKDERPAELVIQKKSGMVSKRQTYEAK